MDESTQSRRRARLSTESQRLLGDIKELHELEKRKRQVDISTPAFHELASRITAKAREVFRMTTIEEELGDRIDTGDVSMNDVDPGGGASGEHSPTESKVAVPEQQGRNRMPGGNG